MKAAELLKFNAEAMKAMSKVGIRMDDCKYIKLWSDYNSLLSANNKKTYVIALLSARYNTSERTICRIIKRFEQDI